MTQTCICSERIHGNSFDIIIEAREQKVQKWEAVLKKIGNHLASKISQPLFYPVCEVEIIS